MMCCKPWIVQVRPRGSRFFFGTEQEAEEFICGFDRVYCGPYYDETEGRECERNVLEMVVFIVENEFRANRNRRNS